jgi:hypothetical protein
MDVGWTPKTARSAGVCQLTATARLRRFLADKNHRKLDPVSLQFFLTTFSRFENSQNVKVCLTGKGGWTYMGGHG